MGRAPSRQTAPAVAKNVNAGMNHFVIGSHARVCRASDRASVPEGAIDGMAYAAVTSGLLLEGRDFRSQDRLAGREPRVPWPIQAVPEALDVARADRREARSSRSWADSFQPKHFSPSGFFLRRTKPQSHRGHRERKNHYEVIDLPLL